MSRSADRVEAILVVVGAVVCLVVLILGIEGTSRWRIEEHGVSRRYLLGR